MLRCRSICSYRLAKALLDANSFIVVACIMLLLLLWERCGADRAKAVLVLLLVESVSFVAPLFARLSFIGCCLL